MALIIDTCVLHKLFPPSASRSKSYQKIHSWLESDKARVVKGGSKYNQELQLASKYLDFFLELDKRRRLIKLDNSEVDNLAATILSSETDPDLDDEHLIAMSIISRAFGVCTSDERAEKFIKKSKYYPSGVSRPKILKETKR